MPGRRTVTFVRSFLLVTVFLCILVLREPPARLKNWLLLLLFEFVEKFRVLVFVTRLTGIAGDGTCILRMTILSIIHNLRRTDFLPCLLCQFLERSTRPKFGASYSISVRRSTDRLPSRCTHPQA